MFRTIPATSATALCTPASPGLLTGITTLEAPTPNAVPTIADLPAETSEMEQAISLYLHTMPNTVFLPAPTHALARASDKAPLHEKDDPLTLSDAGWEFTRMSWPLIRSALAAFGFDIRPLACSIYASALDPHDLSRGEELARAVAGKVSETPARRAA